MAQAFPLLELPNDALIALLSHLGHQDLLSVGATCTLLRKIASSDGLWASFCSPWESKVDLNHWRAGVDSWVALFRLLKFFNDIVGYWTPQGLTPRGGLLYVTWGQLSLIACRVVAVQAVELKLRRFFEVIGLRDGSIKVELITTYGSNMDFNEIHEPRFIVSPSRMEREVYLESTGSYKASEFSNGERELDLLHVHLATSEHTTEGSNNTRREPAKFSSFRRLIVEERCCGKELVGLWSGIYGGHGVEIINVTYTDKEVVGTKILGDPNVPCGQGTFKANFFTESTQIPIELQRIVDLQVFSDTEEFTIMKLYSGFGRIADHNFVNPKWIPGQLLVNQNHDI